MNFEFYLDDLLIEQPQGFADIVLNMKRDDTWHGIFFEASTSDLVFTGEAANYLIDKKERYGLLADVTFRALESCGVYEEPEEILIGKLNFGKYVKSCGNTCSVTIPVEQTGCLMTMRNRYDQKVDMNSGVAFDKLTAIAQYDRMNFEMEIAARELEVNVEGFSRDDVFDLQVSSSNIDHTIVRPTYNDEVKNSIATGQLIPFFNYASTITSEAGIDMTPQLLFEDNGRCFPDEFNYEFSFKGSMSVTAATVFKLNSVILKVVTWDGIGSIFTDSTLIHSFDTGINSGGINVPSDGGDFDHTLSGLISLPDGIGLYGFIDIETEKGVIAGHLGFAVNFDPETYVNISGTKACPPTDANVYMINECLSHVAEAITNGCLKVKSDYYGRTDSEPYASTEDGCGGLRILTSGLQIRRAENPVFFASLKDLFEGNRGIDNIGMGIEVNPNLPNAEWLRIEPVEYFYQDTEILSLPFVPEAKSAIQEQLHYSLIKIGYKKWEVENVNGLDEFNSNKEFRTGLSSVNNTLDLTSNFIAGGYPWEITREQSFADTGAADTKYDNDTFIACVERDAYGFHIEQGNIEDAANIFSPTTAYNWRIRPFYNLMRWFKSLANSYPNIIDTTSKLFFSSGTGNLLASGEIAGAYPTCKLENGEKAENQDLHRTDFADQAEAAPIWKPEYMTFKYPLSVKQYKALKSMPYGYLNVQCGTGDYVKAFIQSINYRLIQGSADFQLKLKWE